MRFNGFSASRTPGNSKISEIMEAIMRHWLKISALAVATMALMVMTKLRPTRLKAMAMSTVQPMARPPVTSMTRVRHARRP